MAEPRRGRRFCGLEAKGPVSPFPPNASPPAQRLLIPPQPRGAAQPCVVSAFVLRVPKALWSPGQPPLPQGTERLLHEWWPRETSPAWGLSLKDLLLLGGSPASRAKRAPKGPSTAASHPTGAERVPRGPSTTTIHPGRAERVPRGPSTTASRPSRAETVSRALSTTASHPSRLRECPGRRPPLPAVPLGPRERPGHCPPPPAAPAVPVAVASPTSCSCSSHRCELFM